MPLFRPNNDLLSALSGADFLLSLNHKTNVFGGTDNGINRVDHPPENLFSMQC